MSYDKMRVKYKNTKIEFEGILFHSKGELKRYKELCLLEKSGEISELERQKKYILQEKYTKNSRKIREISYIADFVYKDKKGVVIEDFKGFRTEMYKLKKKIFEFKYPYEITETGGKKAKNI